MTDHRLAGVLLSALLVTPLPATTLSAASADGAATAPAEAGLYRLPFAARAVDPVADLTARDPAGEDLVLVQLEARGLDTIVDVVASRATVVQPLAPVSLLVWANAAQTRAIRLLDGVRFAGVLPADLRVAASVTENTRALRVTTMSGGRRTTTTIAGGLAEARLLASRPEVYSVADAGGPAQLRDEKSTQIVATGRSRPAPGYDPLARWGVDGSGVRVAIVDSGVDGLHTELDQAVVGCTDYRPGGASCNTPVASSNDPGGHGTHVAGILAGDGSSGEVDADGFRAGQGVAPGMDLWVQNAIGLGAARPNMIALYAESARRGAVVAQNSWGPAGTPRGYDADTRDTDVVVRDADPAAAGHQPMQLVFSIMNGNGGTSTQGTPDEAKNIIGVGGTGSDRGRSGDDLCTCSAHGPALDGRILPDLVAPGQSVISTATSHGTGCRTLTDAPPSHGSCTGTSMASPHVTGGYALFVERYRKDHGVDPSPALVKAALINTATDLSAFRGRDADDRLLSPIPNNQQGWGRMNLDNLFATWNAGVVVIDQDVLLDEAGQGHEVVVRPIDPSAPIKVSLVWTDAPGHGMGGALPALVNDLDLVVSDGQTTWVGNEFAGGWSTTGGSADSLNNVEGVHLQRAGEASYAVRVEAANLLGDGVPGTGDGTDQDFAIFIANAVLSPV